MEPPEGWPYFAIPVRPKAPKKLISLRLDEDVIEHFRAMGSGYQTMINRVLLNYVRAMQKPAEKP